jgi:diaminohydroxyphosphoribosylaminopyrimidine deaminase/5-amino-6-(5-phosphoribosylamino)uracil reductase
MSMHEAFMLEAIELSRSGFPAPNPQVGCIIVSRDQIVGRGFCGHHGGEHAEVVALREAGEKSQGATAYVTLEPCDHFGSTPPCSLALLKAGIKTVYIATNDENPVAKGGADFLRENGILVEIGLCAQKAVAANIQFVFAMANRRPMVTVKAGMTLDGKIALPSGESKWITCVASRQDAMLLRAEIGCVMVGRMTAELDQARLNVRGIDVVNQPLRVALDPRNVLDQSLPIFDDTAPTFHLVGETDPVRILHEIWKRKQTGVLIEGGPTTNAHFMKANLVDQIILYVAPKVLGEGKSWLGTFGLSQLASTPFFVLADMVVIEGDIKLTYRSRNLHDFLSSYKV